MEGMHVPAGDSSSWRGQPSARPRNSPLQRYKQPSDARFVLRHRLRV